jgi:hypothetical protein
MKILRKIGIFILPLLLLACSSSQSLQEYYVDSAENPNYISVDLPASLLNIDEVSLTAEQQKAISSLKKLNILAFQKSQNNVAEYKLEKEKVKTILSDNKFVELMKLNSSFGKGTIKYMGEEDAIDEVIIYGDNKDKGFAVIRVLGKDMNPAHLMYLVQALEKSNYKGEGLESLEKFLK